MINPFIADQAIGQREATEAYLARIIQEACRSEIGRQLIFLAAEREHKIAIPIYEGVPCIACLPFYNEFTILNFWYPYMRPELFSGHSPLNPEDADYFRVLFSSFLVHELTHFAQSLDLDCYKDYDSFTSDQQWYEYNLDLEAEAMYTQFLDISQRFKINLPYYYTDDLHAITVACHSKMDEFQLLTGTKVDIYNAPISVHSATFSTFKKMIMDSEINQGTDQDWKTHYSRNSGTPSRMDFDLFHVFEISNLLSQ
jgi:hypothetical protein